NSRYASRVVGVKLSSPLRVPSFRRRLHDNVRRRQKQQTAADDRRTFSARRQPSYPPSLRAIRKVVCHQTLVGLKVTSQHDNLVDPVVTPIHGCRPSELKQGAVRLPYCPAVAAIDAEQVRILSLMIENQQFTGD